VGTAGISIDESMENKAVKVTVAFAAGVLFMHVAAWMLYFLGKL
jgi:hypothetical protein